MKKLAITLFFVVSGFLSIPALACTTAIISAEASGTGRPILWKQRDTKNVYNDIKYFDGEQYSFTALVKTTSNTVKSVWAGVNEKGFVIANNISYNINPKGSKAGSNGTLMMQALGECASVDEFEQFLKTLPTPRKVNANYAVIDAVGGAAYFEVGNNYYYRFDVKDSPNGYLYRTNFSIKGQNYWGKGYIRYDAAQKILDEKEKGFTAGWIFENAARSFYHGLMKTDLKDRTDQELGCGIVMSKDYIPRHSTTAAIVFEGVNPGEDPKNVIMWNAIGYPPCTYAVPVWVGAGKEIPTCINAKGEYKAPANELAVQLRNTVFSFDKENKDLYLDYLTLRRDILPEVLAAEAKEIEEIEKLKKQFEATGFDRKAVKKYNAEADKRFEEYRQKMEKLVK